MIIEKLLFNQFYFNSHGTSEYGSHQFMFSAYEIEMNFWLHFSSIQFNFFIPDFTVNAHAGHIKQSTGYYRLQIK